MPLSAKNIKLSYSTVTETPLVSMTLLKVIPHKSRLFSPHFDSHLLFIPAFFLSVSASNHRSCRWWKPSSRSLRFPRRSRSWKRGTPEGRRWSGWPRTTAGRAKSWRRTAASQNLRREPSSTRPSTTSHGEIKQLCPEEA